MENNKLFKAVERSTQDIPITLHRGTSNRWTIQSQKTKYVNGKMSGVIGVGYTASIDNSDFLLEEDKSNNEIQITALADDTSGTCVLTQNESGNRINLKITTPPEEKKDYWEILFKPIEEVEGLDFTVSTNINGENGSMAEDGNLWRDWIVNQNRHTINVYISTVHQGNFDMLSWSCFDKDGMAFTPNPRVPDNQYVTIRLTGLGSYTLRKVSTISVSSGTLILSYSFNPPKKYPLDLNFYWGVPT